MQCVGWNCQNLLKHWSISRCTGAWSEWHFLGFLKYFYQRFVTEFYTILKICRKKMPFRRSALKDFITKCLLQNDADKCVELDPKYVKAHFRRGVALVAMERSSSIHPPSFLSLLKWWLLKVSRSLSGISNYFRFRPEKWSGTLNWFSLCVSLRLSTYKCVLQAKSSMILAERKLSQVQQ